jgi:hypothetical protein
MSFVRKGNKEMKVVVRLAVVVAALLLVSNVAFAVPCAGDEDLCYNVTVTQDGGSTITDTLRVCLDDDGIGTICVGSDGCGPVYEWGGGPSWFNFSGSPAFGGNPLWNAWIGDVMGGVAYIQPQGAGKNLLTGIGRAGGVRYLISGTKISCM